MASSIATAITIHVQSMDNEKPTPSEEQTTFRTAEEKLNTKLDTYLVQMRDGFGSVVKSLPVSIKSF